MNKNRVTALFNTTYPIIQGGMVWCSGWRLASAVSNAGGLGLIGSGSMYPEVLRNHIRRCKKATSSPFGVNVPLLYPDLDKTMEIILEEGVRIVFTSAGNPGIWTPYLKKNNTTVVHVVSSVKFAEKSCEAGVDAIVAEGFEAGGHNGREETTTLCLIPTVRDHIGIPLIAAGGIASGRAMLAAEVLGAEGVQLGTRFALCKESSAHEHFKQAARNAGEGSTMLTMKTLNPVRLMRNTFYDRVHLAEQRGASKEELGELLGKGRAKRGIFEGDLDEGELEIGQICSSISAPESAEEVVSAIWEEYTSLRNNLGKNSST